MRLGLDQKGGFDMKKKQEKNKETYKIIISELGTSPFSVMKIAFALMGIIPFLTFFYIVLGKCLYYDVLMGSNGFTLAYAVFISMIGFVYAYIMVRNMLKKLLTYSYEKKLAEDEKAELVASVSHDLKTPLTVVKTGILNILDGIAGPINKLQSNIVKQCLKALDKLNSFISELLNISKQEFIRTNINRKAIDFAKMVKNEINHISPLAKKNNLNLNCSISKKNINVWADENKLSRAVMNILSNAVKYTPPKGRIDVSLSGDSDTVKLAVINTGTGILPEDLNKVFNKYERLDKGFEIEGTGLGLSIAKDIVELHKGRLAVNSKPGKETKFSIILPRDLRKAPRE